MSRSDRELLGYPRPPVLSANTTRAGYEREVERWRADMAYALQLDINTIEHMNRTRGWNVSADFEREMLAWVQVFPSDKPLPTPPATGGLTDAD